MVEWRGLRKVRWTACGRLCLLPSLEGKADFWSLTVLFLLVFPSALPPIIHLLERRRSRNEWMENAEMTAKVIKLIPESAFSASRSPTSKAEFTHQILVQMKNSFFLVWLSQRCWRRFPSFGMRHRLVWYVITDVPEEIVASIFSVIQEAL